MFQTTTNEHWCRKCCKTPCDWELFGLHNQRAWVNSLHCNRVSVTDDLYWSNFESFTSRTRCFYLAIIPLHGNPGIGHLYWIVFTHLELIWSTLYSVYLQVKEDEGIRKEDEERRKEKNMRISSIYKNDLTKVVKLILQDFILLQKLENFLCKTSPDTWYPLSLLFPLPYLPLSPQKKKRRFLSLLNRD